MANEEKWVELSVPDRLRLDDLGTMTSDGPLTQFFFVSYHLNIKYGAHQIERLDDLTHLL